LPYPVIGAMHRAQLWYIEAGLGANERAEHTVSAKQQGADATEGRWLVIPRTLCFIFNGEDVLLMKRGEHRRVFPGRYNGLGGHIERDEDPLACARREVLEETGLTVHDLRLRAVYNIDAGEQTGILLFVFTGISQQREPLVESDEGTLHWIPLASVLDYPLVEDLPLILPRVQAMSEHAAPLFVHVSYDAADQMVMRFADEQTAN
jgi:8-oxo-dGTP diphosphatase